MVETAQEFEMAELVTLDDIRETALSKLPRGARDFLEGGAGDETTLRRNRRAFDRWALRPRVMSGRPWPETTSRFMEVNLTLPVLIAPFGADGLLHPDGQLAVARAAAAAGTVAIVPEAGTHPLERVAAAAPGAVLFGQLHPIGTPDVFLGMVRRYREAGFRGLCITCDSPITGWRERDLHNRYFPDLHYFAGNYAGIEDGFAQLGQLLDRRAPVWPWSRLVELLADCGLPWIAKGIMTADDARAAIDAGAAALLVSNHGGRQLDGQRASLDVLPEIRAAAGPGAAIVLDGGVRRGGDVVKAIALGADAVAIGRPAAYGLAAAGQAGVARVLELLHAEITTILTLLGRGDLAGLDGDALVRVEPD
jgi:4-hydroxymandelate oxidase